MQSFSDLPAWRRAAELTGRRVECAALDDLIGDVRAGKSRALAVHGEPGVGKTALLDYVAVRSLGCRVVRAVGVESEMELVYSGLHQLCAPVLDRLDRLPAPQQDALRTAFGLRSGPPPDRFLVGLAVLGLLSEAAGRQPLVGLVDDLQWVDHASAQVLAFVARRLGAESIGLVFTARTGGRDLEGIPDIALSGLQEEDALALLTTVLSVPIDARVRDQIVFEARGNPLALVQLARGLTPGELAGGYALPAVVPLPNGVEESFLRQLRALPQPTRTLLLIAAADPSGDPALVWRAAACLGITTDAAAHVDSELVEFGARVRFRHPIARSAAYRGASARQRREVHRALAETTDQELDADRRAWHRAQAALGPDEEVAGELERSAGRARARGGLAAASAFLKHAAMLTQEPAKRAERALAAAQAEIQAGALDEARDLLTMTEAGPLTASQQANAGVLRAQLAFVTHRGGDAPVLLLEAAKQLEPIDGVLSRAAYLDALSASIFAGRLASSGGDVLEAAKAARAAFAGGHSSSVADLLLDGTAAALDAGYAAGVPTLRAALAAFGAGLTDEEELRWMWLASITAIRVWDDNRWNQLTIRYLQLARRTGALSELPLALTQRAHSLLFAGEMAAAASLIDELRVVQEATGSGLAPYGAMALAALRGNGAEVEALTARTVREAAERGEGIGIVFAEQARAMLGNGLGQYDMALAAGRRAAEYAKDLPALAWTLPELIEAAARTGMGDVAAKALDQLDEMACAVGTDWALGIQARSQALLAEGEAADLLYRESIARFGTTRLKVDQARAHLLYGEWLRRERRRNDARQQLGTAHTMLQNMGAKAFADRAGRELRAAGGVTGKSATPARSTSLTAQEGQIARMARDGLSNPEIGSRLFISARTVQYHLRKVFTKLGITSRSQLDTVLPE
ncbi:AAA family ATPase [Streptomyces sp. 049-1]|uniref:helix-turn-helix transcriptional regulator n=1 Tax=Streptomyces sp. 049-1 TaxID=2789264 RepID=UPI003980DEC5